MMVRSLVLTLTLLLASERVFGIGAQAGIEGGGNGTILLSDAAASAFGMGAGYQLSLYYAMWTERSVAGKFRFDYLSFNESALQKAPTDYVATGTILKSMNQQWINFGFGGQGEFKSHGQNWMWEVLLGYAIGGAGAVRVIENQADKAPTEVSAKPSTGFSLSGGLTVKKALTPKINGIMSLRTFLLFASVYSEDPFKNRGFILLPILFNVGADFPFTF